MDDPPGTHAGRPITLPTADLLCRAEAMPLLDRLASLVRARTGEDRKTVISGILDGMHDHLDATAPVCGPRGVQEMIDAIRGWFDERIAEEEARSS